MSRRTVLVTGAAGRIGRAFAAATSHRHDLRLTDRPDRGLASLGAFGATIVADLADLAATKALCDGIDTVVHLAGNPEPSATWAELLPSNIVATYNVFAAATSQGCRRVVFASSVHAVSGYPQGRQVRVTDPVNPGSLYGVTKCFGEALGRYLAEQEGVSVVAVRLGAVRSRASCADPDAGEWLDTFVSYEDAVRLLELAVDSVQEGYVLAHGTSANRFNRLDLTDTRGRLGFHPVDDAVALHPAPAEGLQRTPLAHNLSDPGSMSGLRDDL